MGVITDTAYGMFARSYVRIAKHIKWSRFYSGKEVK